MRVRATSLPVYDVRADMPTDSAGIRPPVTTFNRRQHLFFYRASFANLPPTARLM
jgi:hypothetical protein